MLYFLKITGKEKMFRLIFIYGLLVFLPAAVYKTYRVLFAQKAAQPEPYAKLFCIGLVLAAVCLFCFSEPQKSPPQAQYTPPKFKDGVLIPAHMDVNVSRETQNGLK